jgi:hypothetical protein
MLGVTVSGVKTTSSDISLVGQGATTCRRRTRARDEHHSPALTFTLQLACAVDLARPFHRGHFHVISAMSSAAEAPQPTDRTASGQVSWGAHASASQKQSSNSQDAPQPLSGRREDHLDTKAPAAPLTNE